MPKKKTPKSKSTSFSTRLLFATGFLLVLISLAWNIHQKSVLSFDKQPLLEVAPKVIQSTPPQRIIIPKYDIDLGIIESKIVNRVWEINPNGGSHLLGSANPGEAGNIVIYGHNKKDLFGKVLGLKKGDQIKLVSEGNTEHVYEVAETKVVNPTDVYILAPTIDETLTFYTCTGFLDSKRFVVIAKPLN